MKVLHIINSFEGGGAEKLTLQLHELFLRQGLESHALSLMQSSAGDLANTYSLGLISPYRISVFFKLYFYLKQPHLRNLDIIHVHLFPAQIIVLLIIKILGIQAKLITTEHSTFNKRRKHFIGKIVDFIIYNYYQKIICISQGTLTSLIQWQPQIKNKIAVIYNGIDLQCDYYNFTIKPKNEIPIIVSVGRLVELKNYERAILALSKMSEQKFEYWIVGSGFLEQHLKNLVKTLNLSTKVKFLGYQNNVPEILRQADIFLQTSLWEGFGLAVVEAMATGLPVIVSNVSGLKEVVSNSDFETGFLIDPLSEDDITNKISKLLNNPSLRIDMGKNARIQSTKFDIHRTAEEYINLYYSASQSVPLLIPNCN